VEQIKWLAERAVWERSSPEPHGEAMAAAAIRTPTAGRRRLRLWRGALPTAVGERRLTGAREKGKLVYGFVNFVTIFMLWTISRPQPLRRGTGGMHEHGIADHILHTVLNHPHRPPQAIPQTLTVLVSELGGVSEEALQASLDHVCEHEGLPPVALRVETVPLLGCCNACHATSPLEEDMTCPACGAREVRLCGGETVVIRACEYAPGP